jgi:hypothetical protein
MENWIALPAYLAGNAEAANPSCADSRDAFQAFTHGL